jgi:gliding motility-associated-like protein
MITRLRIIFYFLPQYFYCQQDFQFQFNTIAEECTKGSVVLTIGGTSSGDTTEVEWSTGQRNVMMVRNLDAGDYSVEVKIRRWRDSALIVTDTSLFYSIGKELCPIEISKSFSPNDDGYNDFMTINNVDKHPEFELGVYNKWGQKVHGQKNTYVPWDGTWNGIPVPVGVYYVVFFFNSGDKEKIVKADVTIIR